MNEQFFSLPPEKQQRILNAAIQGFALSGYKKASMSEIAADAGISKSLLFHYFRNKQELYLQLCQFSIRITRQSAQDFQVFQTSDFFEMLERNLRSRCSLMRKYPHLYTFSLSAYDEQDPQIRPELNRLFTQLNQQGVQTRLSVYRQAFRPELDFDFALNEITLACEGYLHRILRYSQPDPDRIESEMLQLIHYWKTNLGRRN